MTHHTSWLSWTPSSICSWTEWTLRAGTSKCFSEEMQTQRTHGKRAVCSTHVHAHAHTSRLAPACWNICRSRSTNSSSAARRCGASGVHATSSEGQQTKGRRKVGRQAKGKRQQLSTWHVPGASARALCASNLQCARAPLPPRVARAAAARVSARPSSGSAAPARGVCKAWQVSMRNVVRHSSCRHACVRIRKHPCAREYL